jgi:hypothetical protein
MSHDMREGNSSNEPSQPPSVTYLSALQPPPIRKALTSAPPITNTADRTASRPPSPRPLPIRTSTSAPPSPLPPVTAPPAAGTAAADTRSGSATAIATSMQ